MTPYEEQAIAALKEEINKPDDEFDPWELFPSLYGVYSSEFDDCALAVLNELITRRVYRCDLGAEMFKELLCTAGLCNYGTSPRGCFPIEEFKPFLRPLIERWETYYTRQWGAPPECKP